MREVDLRGIDLNLLVLLDAAIEHRNVTRAAEAMQMSQPAMSRALGRLRKLLNDPILVRGGNGLMPTPRAIALHPQLQRLLNDITHLVSDVPFSPEQLTGYITLAATDHETIVFLPKLMTLIAQAAPQLGVKVIPLFNITASCLHDGSIDLAFGVADATLPSNLCQEALYEDTYITLIRRQHPAGNCLSFTECLRSRIEQFAALNHVQVTAAGNSSGGSAVDNALDKLGLHRRIVLQLPSFITALAVVAESDLVVTLPASIAQRYATQHDLVAIATPIDCPPITHISIWSGVRDADPANQWLRKLVREAASRAGSEFCRYVST
jgi:DNA-binding transcriptional LysR family regulator